MWSGEGQGKGKDMGKGKGKSKSAEGGKGHTLPRERLSAEKFSGTVLSWKGKYGFVKPAEEIQHERASERSGNLFVSAEDLVGCQSLDVGASVMFHVSEDSSGLLGEEVVQTGAGKGASGKGKGGGSPWGAPAKGAPAKGGWGGDSWGKGAPAKGGATKGVYQSSFQAPAAAKGWGKSGGKDSFGKGKDKGKSKSKEGGKGHLLESTRISSDKFLGTVKAWKGKYGWIQPGEEIAHEKADKKNGGLFVSMANLIDRTDLTVGADVEFHIAEDSSGLLAEEVVQY